jgi:hypothetical protein
LDGWLAYTAGLVSAATALALSSASVRYMYHIHGTICTTTGSLSRKR